MEHAASKLRVKFDFFTLIGELVFWRRDFGHRQGRPVMPGRRFGLPA